jgi:hypothetical protein
MALMTCAALRRECTGVSLVNDDDLGACADEVAPARIRLDEVHRNNDKGMPVKQCLVYAQPSLKSSSCAGQDELSFNVKVAAKLPLPLLSKMWGSEDRKAIKLTPIEQFASDQSGFDGLTDTDVISDQKADRIQFQSHEKRH